MMKLNRCVPLVNTMLHSSFDAGKIVSEGKRKDGKNLSTELVFTGTGVYIANFLLFCLALLQQDMQSSEPGTENIVSFTFHFQDSCRVDPSLHATVAR